MEKWKTKPGQPLPLGATITPEGVNFSVFSRHAASLTLVLFEKAKSRSVAEIPLDPEINRTGDIWHIHLIGANSSFRYGYRAVGPFDPKGKGHRFKKNILLDPYARALSGRPEWGRLPERKEGAGGMEEWSPWRCQVVDDEFDWGFDQPLNIHLADSVIYEMHVRGFTRHSSSGVSRPGTFGGIVEKIPYLKELGINHDQMICLGILIGTDYNPGGVKGLGPKTALKLVGDFSLS